MLTITQADAQRFIERPVEDQSPLLTAPELDALLLAGRNGSLLFDIETRPASNETLRELFKDEEVKLPPNPGRFNPADVKYGNTKDPVKRQEKLTSEMSRHEQAVANWAGECEKATRDAWDNFVKESTLSPLTGRVMAIGYGLKLGGTEVKLFLDIEPEDEHGLLLRFWRFVSLVRKRGHKLVSFNGHSFDISFCRRRSWAYEDINPLDLVTKYRSYEDFCVDTYEVYKKGGGYRDHIKLRNLAKMMGVTGKLEGVTGDMFHSLYKTNPELAVQYLTLDVLALAAVAERQRVI